MMMMMMMMMKMEIGLSLLEDGGCFEKQRRNQSRHHDI